MHFTHQQYRILSRTYSIYESSPAPIDIVDSDEVGSRRYTIKSPNKRAASLQAHIMLSTHVRFCHSSTSVHMRQLAAYQVKADAPDEMKFAKKRS